MTRETEKPDSKMTIEQVAKLCQLAWRVAFVAIIGVLIYSVLNV